MLEPRLHQLHDAVTGVSKDPLVIVVVPPPVAVNTAENVPAALALPGVPALVIVMVQSTRVRPATPV